METTRVVGPTAHPRQVRTAEGQVLTVPEGWVLLPPGDAGLTRRVKAAGPSWTVVEKKGRKLFSRGVWAPAAHVEAARTGLAEDRADPAWQRRLEADAARRARAQAEYEVDFANAALAFLRFAPTFASQARLLAVAVTAQSAPVGSGTVARTARLTLERKAEAAVIAWMRHQTTGYDDMRIARVKGARRETRRELAGLSRQVLDAHRRDVPHAPASCSLCSALAKLGA